MARRLRAAALIAAVLALLLGSHALGQDATPAAGSDIPSPSECTVKPVSFLSLVEAASEAQSQANRPTGSTTIAPDQLTQGPPASADDLAGITATTREIVACANAKDPLRVAALLTQGFKARLAADLVAHRGRGIRAVADRLPILAEIDPNQQLAAIPIRKAWYPQPPYKAVDALLAPTVQGLKEQRTFFVRFSYNNYAWQIDDVRLVTSLPASPVASPAASSAASSAVFGSLSPTVGMVDIGFQPKAITVPAHASTALRLVGHGAIGHNFSVTDHKNPNVKNLGISVDVAPGQTKAVSVNPPAGDDYVYSNVPGHETGRMFGRLHVT